MRGRPKQTSARKESPADSPARLRHIKVAITIPEADFERIETVRAKLDLSRSKFLVLAARQWLSRREKQKLVDRYVRGYELSPEDTATLKVMESVQSEALGEDMW